LRLRLCSYLLSSFYFYEKRGKVVQAVQAVQTPYFTTVSERTACYFSRPIRPSFELIELIEKNRKYLNNPLLFKRIWPDKKIARMRVGPVAGMAIFEDLNPLPLLGFGQAIGARRLDVQDGAEPENKGARGTASARRGARSRGPATMISTPPQRRAAGEEDRSGD